MSPDLPDEPLNTPLVPAEAISTHNAQNWTLHNGRAKGGRVGIWASFCQLLVGAGGDANIGWARGINQQWSVRNMRTCTFHPSTAFIEAEVQKDEVSKFILRTKFRQKVYMITGVKIVTGAKGFTAYMQKRSFDGSLGVDGTPWGVPVGAGPQFEVRGSSGTTVGFEDADDFVFAFQLREIKVKKTGKVEHKQFWDGDFFGFDDPSKEQHVQDNQAVECLGLSDVDAGGDDFDLEEMEAVEEENGEECICVKLDE